MKSPAWVAMLVFVATIKQGTPRTWLEDDEEVSFLQTTFQDGGASSPFQYFCKHNAHVNIYHEDCSVCVGGPICCDKTQASLGPGGTYCNFGQAASVGRCAGSTQPNTCWTNSKGCEAVKHHLETKAFHGTGRVFPYWSLGGAEGLYDKDSGVRLAIIVFHGFHGNSGDQKACYVMDAVKAQLKPEHHRRVLILAPQFYYPTDNHTNEELSWTRGGWLQGRQSYNGFPGHLSSFAVVDELLKELTLKGTFPNLHTVRLVGFSAGGQFVQKYAAFGKAYDQIAGVLGSSLSIEFVVASPNTLTYFDNRRPVLDIVEVCEQGSYCNTARVRGAKFEFRVPVNSPCNMTHNNWKYGLGGNLMPYLDSVDLNAAIKSFGNKKITYLVGNRDTCNNHATALPCQKRCRGTGCDGSCEANLQGFCRHMRLHAWFQYVDGLYGGRHRHAIHDVPVGHDSYLLWTNEVTLPHVVGTNSDFDVFGP